METWAEYAAGGDDVDLYVHAVCAAEICVRPIAAAAGLVWAGRYMKLGFRTGEHLGELCDG